jgi:hypothetical protein
METVPVSVVSEPPGDAGAVRTSRTCSSVRLEGTFLKLDAAVAIVSHRVERGRCAGCVGNQFDAQIAVQHLDGGALGDDRRIVDRLKTGPADGQRAVEAGAIGFVQDILNGG